MNDVENPTFQTLINHRFVIDPTNMEPLCDSKSTQASGLIDPDCAEECPPDQVNHEQYAICVTDTLTQDTWIGEGFTKSIHILDPLLFMKGNYDDLEVKKTKTNHPMNQGMIDCLATEILSGLVETNTTPHFPLFYHKSITTSKYSYDITPEYSDYLDEEWFMKNKDSLFSISIRGNPSLHHFHTAKCKPALRCISGEEEEISADMMDGSLLGCIEPIESLQDNCVIEIEASAIEKQQSRTIAPSSTNQDGLNDSDEEYRRRKQSLGLTSPSSGEDSDMSQSLELSTKRSHNDVSEYSNLDMDDDISVISGTSIDDTHGSGDSVDDSDDDEEDDMIVFVDIEEMPQVRVTMEKCGSKFEELCHEYGEEEDESKKNDLEKRIFSVLFQTICAMSLIYSRFKFIHNDLHTGNILLKPTQDEFIYYRDCVNKVTYRVPTYGYVVKIIDFGRSMFTFHGTEYVSDAFLDEGEAEGQYVYPGLLSLCVQDISGENVNIPPEEFIYPNQSFDLARLACNMLEECFEEPPEMTSSPLSVSCPSPPTKKRGIPKRYESKNALWNLLQRWATSTSGVPFGAFDDSMESLFEDFELYCAIAKDAWNAAPQDAIRMKPFAKYVYTGAIPEDVNPYPLQ